MPPSIASSARKTVRKGTDPPSFSPLSTLSAWRIRSGTRSLVTIAWPSPASVGARTVPTIAASQIVKLVKRRDAMVAPAAIVRGRPMMRSRAGSAAFFRSTFTLIRDASVKSTSTSASSPVRRRNSLLIPSLMNGTATEPMSTPARIKTIGAVTSSFCRRRETRAKAKTTAANTAISSSFMMTLPRVRWPVLVLALG